MIITIFVLNSHIEMINPLIYTCETFSLIFTHFSRAEDHNISNDVMSWVAKLKKKSAVLLWFPIVTY